MKYSNDAFQKDTFQEGWKIWSGLEQEGPFKGYKTLFIGSCCSALEFRKIVPNLVNDFQQLYINPGFIIGDLEAVNSILELGYKGIVTISLPVEFYLDYKILLPSVHFMVILPEFSNLKDVDCNDTLRIDCGNMTTYSVQIKDMVKTSSQSYLEDVRIL